MKSKLVTKKLFVCVLSVLMLVMMCSVAVSAAGKSYTLTVEGNGDRIITGGIAKNEGGHISNFGDGATVTIVGVDLTDIGAVTIVGNSGAANGVNVEMRLNNETGKLLGTFTASDLPADGWGKTPWDLSTIEIDGVTGFQTICLVSVGGGMNMTAMKFEVKAVEEPPVEALTKGTVSVQDFGSRLTAGGIAKNEGEYVSSFGDGATVTIKGVDLTGVGSMTIVGNSGAANGINVEVRLDNENGKLLGTFTASDLPADGWGKAPWELSTIEIEEVSGAQTLCLVSVGGGMNMTAMKFAAKAVEEAPLDLFAEGGVSVKDFGGRLTAGGIAKNEGEYVSSFGDGATVTIKDIDLTGVGSMTIVGNSGAANGVTVEVRLDNENGKLLGTFTASDLPADGWGKAPWDLSTIEIEEVSGVHTICLVSVGGGMNMTAMKFAEESASTGDISAQFMMLLLVMPVAMVACMVTLKKKKDSYC